MSKLTNTPTQRKPGRPPTFKEPTKVVSVIMPLSMVERLERDGDNISETIREIIKEYDRDRETYYKVNEQERYYETP